jgi:hypothetical protein
MIQVKNEYPKDFIVELKGLSPYIVGRVSVSFDGLHYDCETDIVFSETGKIYTHISIRRTLEDEKEAFDQGLHDLKMHMRKKQH